MGKLFFRCLLVLLLGSTVACPAAFAQSDKVTQTIQHAQNGDAAAANSLGVWYEKGKFGLPKDAAQAIHWYTLAAEKGNALALHNLGDCYRSGVGVPKDVSKAYEYYLDAARRGLPLGYEDVGDSILARKGLEGTLALGDKEWSLVAKRWYHKAASHGRTTARAKAQKLGAIAPVAQDSTPLPICMTETLGNERTVTGTWLKIIEVPTATGYAIKKNNGETIEIITGDGIVPGFEDVTKGDTVQIRYKSVRYLDPYTAECRVEHSYVSGDIIIKR